MDIKNAKVNVKGDDNEVNVNSVINKVGIVEEITKLSQKGDFAGVSDLLSRALKSAAAQHPVYPYWHYKFDVNKSGGVVVSHVPTNVEAAKTHPLHGKIQLNIPDEYKKFGNMGELLRYSFQRQMPLEFDADFVQTIIGETIIDEFSSESGQKIRIKMEPQKFPSPRPFKLYFKSNVFSVDYLLIGVKKVEESVIYLNNSQQVEAKIFFELAINIEDKTGNISIKIPEIHKGDTEAHLILNNFLYLAKVEKLQFALKSLENGCDIFVAYEFDVDAGDDESLCDIVDILEKLYKIEQHFSVKFYIPEQFTQDDFETLALLNQILEGKPIEGVLTELSLRTNDRDTIKNIIMYAEQDTNGLSLEFHTPSQSIKLFGAEIVFDKVESRFESVKPKDLERLKRKYEMMDPGDTIEIVYVPGENNKCSEKYLLN